MEKKPLRIVFMGTPEFAVESLKVLVENNYNIVGVITMPNKPAGRGQQIQISAVKKYALEHNLQILQPTNLKDKLFLNELKSLNADLQIVVAFRMLPMVVWQMPALGTFNLHASLLPQYRGAAPINWAIINGEKETGVSTFFLQQEIDTGEIIFREKVNITENESAGELHDVLMKIGATLVLKTVRAIENGEVQKQNQSKFVTKDEVLIEAPKLFKHHCNIHWKQNTDVIHNIIRGLSPYPAAYTTFVSPDGKEYNVKIFSSSKVIESHNLFPGQIFSDGKHYLKIACEDGYIVLNEFQLAGKKRMAVTEFLRGFAVDNHWKAMDSRI